MLSHLAAETNGFYYQARLPRPAVGLAGPATIDEVDGWLAAGVLNPTHALLREDIYLLAEDRTISDRSLCLSIVGAIANGNATQSGISSALGRGLATLRHPLEMLVRTGFVERVDDETLGGTVTHVSPAVLNCCNHQPFHECDVVAIARQPNRAPRVLMLGEAKCTHAPRTMADLARLEHLRDLIGVHDGPDASHTRVAMFAGHGGFADDLVAEAGRRPDVELVDLDRLYGGD